MDDMTKIPAIKKIERSDSDYPPHLRAVLDGKAPDRLYLQGNVALLELDSIGFCGSRNSSDTGINIVKDCAEQAVESGLVVVSGNAAGVDIAAHYHALNAGGSTILVLPEGISHLRPRRDLASVWDWERVLVVSQFEPDHIWKGYRAMERNQVIIGLSKAIVVIEAGEKGGTMHAGEKTLKLKIPLYVAEYDDMPDDALGSKKLLQMGGKALLRSQSEGRVNMEGIFADIAKERTPSAQQMKLAL